MELMKVLNHLWDVTAMFTNSDQFYNFEQNIQKSKYFHSAKERQNPQKELQQDKKKK